jgi:deoxyribonuclease-4
MLRLGAHMSISGGPYRALERARAFAMEACQIFTKNERQWVAKPLDPAATARFAEELAVSGIEARHLVAHDSYLINMASPDDAMWEKSRLAFRDELDRCHQLGVPFLVTHPGAHLKTGEAAGIARVAEAINRIHGERPDGATAILLETTAGQGTALGRTFEELAAIIDRVEDKNRVGVCLDTCHVFVAGYDLRTPETYAATMAAFERVIGLDRLKAIHLNDARKELGSRIDRHAHIGEGEIGLEGFRALVNDPRLSGLPGILETEKGDDGEEDRRNLATLRGLVVASAAA